jgi:hypothetical protein
MSSLKNNKKDVSLRQQQRREGDSESDREKITEIRAALPAVTASLYLNTGTNGPLPRRSHEALLSSATVELEQGRIRPERYVQLQQEKNQVRAHGPDPLLQCLIIGNGHGLRLLSSDKVLSGDAFQLW